MTFRDVEMRWAEGTLGPGECLFTRTDFTSRAASPSAGRELANAGNLLFLCILAVFFRAFHVVTAHPPHLTPQPTEGCWAEAAEQRLLQAHAAFPRAEIPWECCGDATGWRWEPAGPGVGGSPPCRWKPEECFRACSHPLPGFLLYNQHVPVGPWLCTAPVISLGRGDSFLLFLPWFSKLSSLDTWGGSWCLEVPWALLAWESPEERVQAMLAAELWLQLGLERCHQFPAEDAVTRTPPPCQ